jgi:hypothetical protein
MAALNTILAHPGETIFITLAFFWGLSWVIDSVRRR